MYTEFAFNNEQSFDFEGLKGRMLSSSYTPIQGEPNHDALMKELKKLYDLFNIDGKVTFKYETGGYLGEVQP